MHKLIKSQHDFSTPPDIRHNIGQHLDRLHVLDKIRVLASQEVPISSLVYKRKAIDSALTDDLVENSCFIVI